MKRRSRSGKLSAQTVLGFAWFDREQWSRMAEIAEDRTAMDDSFDDWEASALSAVRDLRAKGVTVEKVPIDVPAFAAWCREKGLPVTSGSRAKYVSFVLQARGKHDKA